MKKKYDYERDECEDINKEVDEPVKDHKEKENAKDLAEEVRTQIYG